MESNAGAAASPLVEEYLGVRMGADFGRLLAGRPSVIESPRRLQKEPSYGFIHGLWWTWLNDGRSIVSVPPGAGKVVSSIIAGVRNAEQLFDDELTERLKVPINASLRNAGLGEIDRVFSDVCFACDASLLRRHSCGDCRRLTDESLRPAEGLGLPTHCFPDGIVYGVIADGVAVSIAFAHRAGVMEARVADLAVETAAAYRRRGYAKTAVSAVVEHITRRGGEALYRCRPDNVGSIATARSVGFVPYGRSLVLSVASPKTS